MAAPQHRRDPHHPIATFNRSRLRPAGPAELFAEVSSLLVDTASGEAAFERLGELLRVEPVLAALRFDGEQVARLAADFAPERVLPAIVPARFGRQLLDAFAQVATRRRDPLDQRALALGRYLAILDDVEGAPGVGQNPLFQLVLELTIEQAEPRHPHAG